MTVDFVEMSPRQILELNWKSFKLALKYALDGYKHNEVLKGVETPGEKKKGIVLVHQFENIFRMRTIWWKAFTEIGMFRVVVRWIFFNVTQLEYADYFFVVTGNVMH